jgi:hypothetical protein
MFAKKNNSPQKIIPANFNSQVQVGVGTLAGSTVMLLTIPWFLAVLGGRVELDAQGKPMYGKLRGLASLEHKSEEES